METRQCNISRTTNATEFIKTILESSYKVPLGPCSLVAPTWPNFVLTALEIYATNSLQTFIILMVTCPKLRIYIFYKVHKNIPKCASNQFASTTQREIKAVWKFWKNVFLADVFLQNEKIWNTQFSWNWKYGQRSVISKKLRYGTNTFLKLQLHKVAIFFSIFTLSYHNYRCSKIQMSFEVISVETSLELQLKVLNLILLWYTVLKWQAFQFLATFFVKAFSLVSIL